MDCLVAEGHQRPAYIIRRFAHAALTFGWPLSIAAVRLVRDDHPACDQAVSEFPVGFARNTALHQPVCVELPVLVTIGAKPMAAVVMMFVGETYGDAVGSILP